VAKVLEITEEHAVGKSPGSVVEKVVEITEDCPFVDSEGGRCVLLFTRAPRGRIVQIYFPYPGEELMGAFIHFFVDSLDLWVNQVEPRDDVFGTQAERIGLSKKGLRALIERHAPPANV